MRTKVRVGIIGIGYGDRVHLPAFRQNKRCEVKAICATTRARAERVARLKNIPHAYGDWRQLLKNPEIDAVSIATPPYLQPRIVLAALAAGKAIFCEKPLAISSSEARRCAHKAKEKRLANIIDFEFPELEAWKNAKAILANGEIGVLRHCSVSWNVETYANKMGVQNWKTQTSKGGGTLYAFASHAFYNVEWLAGRIESLSAKLSHARDLPGSGDTLVNISLKLKSNAAATILISTHSFLGHGHRVEFYGSKGTLVLDNPTTDYTRGFRLFRGTRRDPHLKRITVSTPSEKSSRDGRITPVSRLVDRFVDWADKGIEGAPDLNAGLRVQSLLEAAQRSDRSGKWVRCLGNSK